MQVKHSYLHEALVNLDPSNPTTRAHSKAVITGLDSALRYLGLLLLLLPALSRQYIKANPNSKMTRNMKLLVMACGNMGQ